MKTEKKQRKERPRNINSLGKSMRDGNIGRKDPGEINAGKIFRNAFSNLQAINGTS